MSRIGTVELKKEERETIEKMLKLGQKLGTISKALERTYSCVKQEIRKNGGRSVYNAEAAHEAARARARARARKVSYNYTEEEIKIIQEGIKKGLSMCRIAANAKLRPYNISRYFKVNNIPFQKKNYTAFEDRITALEMQVEVMQEIIDELSAKVEGR